ncbi:hypothetical protein F5Y04DRAFT_286539 [Hypomontagnella monticulosa]|nr:hypothetical protein F5Y04DRAFT_286539 [Hypomontagnella monticulosa]
MADDGYFELSRQEVQQRIYTGERLELIGLFDDTVMVRSLPDDEDGGSGAQQDQASGGGSLSEVLVPQIMRRLRGGDEGDGRIKINEDESYFPTPIANFLIDQPKKLVCQICYTRELKMSAKPTKETAPAILPCGHVGCYECMNAALDRRPECPFCRVDMTHPECGHHTKPVLISYRTIGTLSKTFPEGGAIGLNCRECRDDGFQRAALDRMEVRAGDIKHARQREGNRDPSERMKAMLEKFSECVCAYERIVSNANEFW